jgi:hypothetical protein
MSRLIIIKTDDALLDSPSSGTTNIERLERVLGPIKPKGLNRKAKNRLS